MADEEKEEIISSDEKIDSLKTVFSNQRKIWTRKIKNMAKVMKENSNLGQIQSILFTEIAILTNEKVSLIETMISLNKAMRPKKKEALRNAKLNEELKPKTAAENNIMMDAELNIYLEREELLGMQIEFLESTLKNLNSMVWGIKNFIDLQKAGIE